MARNTLEPITSRKWKLAMRTEIVTGMADADYRAHEGVSFSGVLKPLLSGIPAKVGVPVKPTESMMFGNRWDEYLLFGKVPSVDPPDFDGRTVKGKAWRNANPLAISSEGAYSWQTLQDMKASVEAHPYAAEFLKRKGDNQVAMFAVDPPTGLQLKCLADRIVEDENGRMCIIDLKSTDDVSFFEHKASSLKYYLQAAFYTYIAELLGHDPTFIFIATEVNAPYATRVGAIDAYAIYQGRKQVRKMLDLWAELKGNPLPSCKVNDEGQPCGLETFQLRIWNN